MKEKGKVGWTNISETLEDYYVSLQVVQYFTGGEFYEWHKKRIEVLENIFSGREKLEEVKRNEKQKWELNSADWSKMSKNTIKFVARL